MKNVITFFKMIFYTFLYLMGKRVAREEIQAASDKKALEETTKILIEREETRKKYDALKKTTPNDWDSLRRVRKTSSN